MLTRRLPRAALSLVALSVLTACSDNLTNPDDAGSSTLISGTSGGTGSPKADLGEKIFTDTRLSIAGNQSCQSCHSQSFGWTSGNPGLNLTGAVLPGSLGRFGDRKPMSIAYAAFAPGRHYDPEEDLFVGGMFWDARASGEVTGSPAADQAMGPFLNPAEMALPDNACVVHKVATGSYRQLYAQVWGSQAQSIAFPANTALLCSREGTKVPLSTADRAKVNAEYVNIAFSIAEFEKSAKVNPFNSRYDRSLAGTEQLTAQEKEGLGLFTGKANCANCHTPGERALFTTFELYNIGVPRNPLNPATKNGATDLGLGAVLNLRERDGQMRIPTLRNVDRRPLSPLTKAYMHNGVFKSLEQVVHFYNTRDVLPRCTGTVLPTDPRFGTTCWPAPSVSANVLQDEIGNLGLTPKEEAAIVAFLRTLSDR